MKTLKYGSRGAEVTQLQNILNDNGAELKADGIFGKLTRAAVKVYQTSKGLTADGIVGTMTWSALLGEEPLDIEIPCEDLKQFSAPHGSMTYGKAASWGTYKTSGCGATSFAIAQRAYGLAPEGEKPTETIQRLGAYAVQKGYRVEGHGTTAGLFNTNGCKYTSTGKAATIIDALKAGKLVILLIRKGFPNGYGGDGHYIVAYGVKGNTVLLRDVGSSLESHQKAPADKITTGLKAAYIISKR